MSEQKPQRVEELESQLAQAERDGAQFCQRIAELEAEREKVVTIIMGDTQCGNLPPYIEGVVRDLNELRAVVEKLPRTADGKYVVPNMGEVVWWPSTGGFWRGFDIERDSRGEWWVDDARRKVSNCYSTRAAAEKAVKK